MNRKIAIRLGVIALAAAVVGVAWQSQAADDGGRELVRRAISAGRYAEASRLAVEWCARVEAENGADSLTAASALDVLVEARLKNGEGGAPTTLALAERVVHIKEQRLGHDHLETVVSLHNLGNAHAQRGEFTAAVRLHEQGLKIRSTSPGAGRPIIADSLDEVALALIHLERFPEARQRLDESLTIREAGAADAQLALARTLELIGMLLRYSGAYATAVGHIDRALAIQSRLAPDHPDGLQTSELRGDLWFLMGDALAAQRTWASALALGERTLGANHPAIADVLSRLGLAAFSLGNLAEARQQRERALAIGEAALAPCHPELGRLLVGVANSLQLDGDYSEAQKLHRRALTTIEKCQSAGSYVTTDHHATTVYNMAALADEIGDLAEADRLYADAVQIWSRGLGPNHPFVATGLGARAEVVAARGQLASANALYQQALAIRRRTLGADHPLVGWTLTSLARMVADRGEVSAALRYVDQAIAIYKKSGASDDPDHFARVLELRGALETRRGNLGAARNGLIDALAERERIFGSAHPLTAATRAALARVDFARGTSDLAFGAALEAEQAGRDHLRFTVRYLPERQAMAYAAKRPRGLDLALSIAASGAVAEPARLFDAVIQSRGVILDELAARSRAVNESDPQLASPQGRVGAARQRFANLVVRSLQEPVPRALLDEAREQKEEAERDQAERSLDARAELARASTGLAGIRRVLPPDSALVSFVRYERVGVRVTGEAARQVPSYAAFILESGPSEVAFIPLGTAASLEALVEAWRAEAAGASLVAGLSPGLAESAYLTVAARLRRQAWDPLVTHLTNTKRVFVVPDGLLNLVNFAALPDRSRRYIAESDMVIHYLSTERDLVVSEAIAAGGRTLLAVGGASFGRSTGEVAAQPSVPRPGCQGLGRAHFEDLPGSLNEVTDIGRLWSESESAGVTMLTGAAATETAVKLALVGRRVVHLATHGFFFGADCTAGMVGFRAVGGLVPATAKMTATVAENPLLLAGLALAGANRRQGTALNQDEGILTAEEIAGLNLQGTEWAVLSACDTGLGEFRAGEGVFGLRRAFQIAGAHTVIMSLWSVEDRSARVWMRALYEGRLQHHLSTADAVHEANITVLRQRRASARSTHPLYWAAFVAAGDWR